MQRKRVLPLTLWSAKSLWSFEPKSLITLCLSLGALGVGHALLVMSNLGSAPWTVLAQGVAVQANISVGWGTLIVSCVTMMIFLALKMRFGLGTVLSLFIIPLFLDFTVAFVPHPETLLARLGFVVLGTLVFSVGSAFYLTCHQGTGPRDGIMVKLCQVLNLKVGIVRSSIDLSVFILGFLLGGVVGIGSVIFALCCGWVIQFSLASIGHIHCYFHKGQDCD